MNIDEVRRHLDDLEPEVRAIYESISTGKFDPIAAAIIESRVGKVVPRIRLEAMPWLNANEAREVINRVMPILEMTRDVNTRLAQDSIEIGNTRVTFATGGQGDEA